MTRQGAASSRGAVCLGVTLALMLSACTAGTQSPVPSAVSTSGTSTSPPSTGGGPVPAEGQLSPLGAHWDMSRLSDFDPYLETVRGSSTYHEVVWCKVEKTQGQQDWRSVDEIADAAQRHGIALYLKIRVGACWATGGSGKIVRGSANKTESAMPKDLNAYTGFLRALVDRYKGKGVHTYAIENEVNSASFWDGTPADFTRLTEIAAKELRAADPQVRIADAGISSTSYGYGIADQLLKAGKSQDAIEAFNAYFQRRIGTRGDQIPSVTSVAQLQSVLASEQGRRNLDFLAAAKSLAERKVTDIRQVHFYEPWAAVPLLLSYVMAQTPKGTPVEAWEVGSFWKSASSTDASRAQDMVKTVSLLLAGGIKQVMWLPLATNSDNRRGEEIRYGLLDPDGGLRPAGQAMKEMVVASRGATVSPVRTAQLQGVSFERAGANTLVVWSNASAGEVQLQVGANTLAAQVGLPLKPVTNSKVSVGATPQLVQTSLSLQQVLSSQG